MENENKDKNDKPIYTSTIVTEDTLCEMVFDTQQNKTFFFSYNRYGKMESYLEEVKVDGKTYLPLSKDNDLISKGVVLFPSLPCPYNSEEELLGKIKTYIHKYVDISVNFEEISNYYAPFTWLYDRFDVLPYLRAIGDFGSGKSRFLKVMGCICYKPTFTAGATTASPIFRIISQIKGTLVLDEGDFKHSDMSSEIIKILNTGYQKGTPVLRSEGKGIFVVKAYDVYCPKIVATRETFTDKALESRFLIEEMGIGTLRTDIPRNLNAEFFQEAEEIRNMLLMWRFKNYFKEIKEEVEIIEGIHPRLNQIVLPLLSIIQDEKIKENLITFIKKYNTELVADRGLSWESDIVFAIFKLEYTNLAKSLTVKEITTEINNQIEIGEEKMEARKVGWYLRSRLQLKTYKTRRGYVLDFKLNRTKLDFWKERFGITDNDIQGIETPVTEDENDVNIINVEETKLDF